MIKAEKFVVESKNYITGERRVRADLLSDTKEEINEIGINGSTVIGLNEKDILTFHSTAFTTNSELGILKSDGTWKW